MGSWAKIQFLGKGLFGTMCKAVPLIRELGDPDQDNYDDYHDGRPLITAPAIAVKSADFEFSASLQREGELLRVLSDCPGIIRCFGEDMSVENGKSLYNLLLEYAPSGSLKSLMERSGGRLPESEVKRYTRMILKALTHVHEKGYAHCDIKPGNILVFPSKNGENTVKIADFGLAQKTRDNIKSCSPRSGGSHCGDLPFASILHGSNMESMDIWYLGYMVAEMLTGKSVWEYREFWVLGRQVPPGARKPRNRQKTQIPQNLSDEGRDFVMNCLDKRSERTRIAERLLNHPFIIGEPNGVVDDTDEIVPSRISVDDGGWVSRVSMFGDLRALDNKEKLQGNCERPN
ncbi:mitogen-activated protein kinase kinase kinase 20-like [Diospyros lotus]|uniref:mitogen-activated protein kinase kinase kinase 20-like n=1 Tax=Diospyros lotus TaxID=55363 RepID=UPI00224D43B7|nr:mitogen-activated protein kinase kinase kinase 20-like [Diospyros lotus]